MKVTLHINAVANLQRLHQSPDGVHFKEKLWGRPSKLFPSVHDRLDNDTCAFTAEFMTGCRLVCIHELKNLPLSVAACFPSLESCLYFGDEGKY